MVLNLDERLLFVVFLCITFHLLAAEGTKYAFQRFGYYNPAGQEWLKQWAEKIKDEFVKNCIGEAFASDVAAPVQD